MNKNRKVMASALAAAMALNSLAVPVWAESTTQAAGTGTSGTYTTTEFADDGFIRVINPNGGKQLSYSSTSGMQLLEVTDGDYTYAFKDLDKDGELDDYEDWRLDQKERAKDLSSRLTIEEMSALMLYPFMGTPEGGELDERTMALLEKGCRYVLSNSYDSVSDNVKWNNAMQAWLEENDPYGIPMNRAADPLNTTSNAMASPDKHTEGSVVRYNDTGVSGWPGNLGLAATFNPEYALIHGQAASQEYRALGITTALSPQMDLATEPRWTRYSGTFGENTQLDSDMAVNYVKGFQSSWSGLGADAEDLGWSTDSVVCMAKHFPGDGAAEGGREAHSNNGKYNIYPGNNFEGQLEPFRAVINIEDSLTGGIKAIMPSYSIAMNEYSSIGEPVGSGYSSYKLTTVLREELGFDGLICSDWEITNDKVWGVEDLTMGERHLKSIQAGNNMFGGSANVQANIDAYEMGVLAGKTYDGWNPAMGVIANEEEDTAEADMTALYQNSAYQALLISFYSGLFDDPFIALSDSEETCGNEAFREAGYEAQLASVVMLKNKDNIISQAADGEKKTVYVPMTFTAASSGWGGDVPASIGLCFGSEEALSQFFNVVTDEISPDADQDNLTKDDIIRRTDFTGVDFSIISFNAPKYGGYDQSKVDLDNSDGTIDNGYYPVSLQFGDYYADPEVCQDVIGLDASEELEWTAAGGETGTSRSYAGKTTTGDTSTLELIADVKERSGLPIVAYVEATNPFCAYEFEENVDAILVGFSISQTAAAEVISGQYEPQGLLPMQLPKDMATVEQQYADTPYDMTPYTDSEGNTYDFAFGMNWSGVISDERTATYTAVS